MSEFKSHGENLIFILSQPRSGSTLLQRILGNHPDIHTVAEPWMLLHPIYALRNRGHWAEYNNYSASLAMKVFFKELPGGEEDYFEGLRRMFTYIYEQAVSKSKKKYFLDKTPRYYLIIPELLKLFPNAHYVFLFRNPLAILSSVLYTWRSNLEILLLYQNKLDLMVAPQLLLEGTITAGNQGRIIHYEALVNNPNEEVRKVCEFIGINHDHSMTDFSKHEPHNWYHGDRVNIKRFDNPKADLADKWVQGLNNSQVWRLTSDYLNALGPELINSLGYSFDELNKTLQENKPNGLRLLFTFRLNTLLKLINFTETGEALQRGSSWIIHSLASQGLRQTIAELPRKYRGDSAHILM